MAFTTNLSITQGLPKTIPFTWQAAGVPVDLTGCTAKMQVKDAAGNALLTLTTANGGIALGGTQGTINVIFSAAQALASLDQMRYDLVIFYAGAGGNGDVLMEGVISVKQPITSIP